MNVCLLDLLTISSYRSFNLNPYLKANINFGSLGERESHTHVLQRGFWYPGPVKVLRADAGPVVYLFDSLDG